MKTVNFPKDVVEVGIVAPVMAHKQEKDMNLKYLARHTCGVSIKN